VVIFISIMTEFQCDADERRQRQGELFKVLSDNDLVHWADRFLVALKKPPVEVELPARLRIV
jgi:trehalose-6-phosphate synthase